MLRDYLRIIDRLKELAPECEFDDSAGDLRGGLYDFEHRVELFQGELAKAINLDIKVEFSRIKTDAMQVYKQFEDSHSYISMAKQLLKLDIDWNVFGQTKPVFRYIDRDRKIAEARTEAAELATSEYDRKIAGVHEVLKGIYEKLSGVLDVSKLANDEVLAQRPYLGNLFDENLERTRSAEMGQLCDGSLEMLVDSISQSCDAIFNVASHNLTSLQDLPECMPKQISKLFGSLKASNNELAELKPKLDVIEQRYSDTFLKFTKNLIHQFGNEDKNKIEDNDDVSSLIKDLKSSIKNTEEVEANHYLIKTSSQLIHQFWQVSEEGPYSYGNCDLFLGFEYYFSTDIKILRYNVLPQLDSLNFGYEIYFDMTDLKNLCNLFKNSIQNSIKEFTLYRICIIEENEEAVDQLVDAMCQMSSKVIVISTKKLS